MEAGEEYIEAGRRRYLTREQAVVFVCEHLIKGWSWNLLSNVYGCSKEVVWQAVRRYRERSLPRPWLAEIETIMKEHSKHNASTHSNFVHGSNHTPVLEGSRQSTLLPLAMS
jgi:hypothetical protein